MSTGKLLRLISILFLSFSVSYQIQASEQKHSRIFGWYLDQVSSVSGYPIQKQVLTTYYASQSCTALDEQTLSTKHDEFNSRRASLIKEWERETGQTWPIYGVTTTCVVDGTCIHKQKGWKYDAHHIIPQSYNGPNDWRNLVPLDVHQHNRIHGKMSKGMPPERAFCCELFPNSCGLRQ